MSSTFEKIENYTPTSWHNYNPPSIDQINLAHIEKAIKLNRDTINEIIDRLGEVPESSSVSEQSVYDTSIYDTLISLKEGISGIEDGKIDVTRYETEIGDIRNLQDSSNPKTIVSAINNRLRRDIDDNNGTHTLTVGNLISNGTATITGNTTIGGTLTVTGATSLRNTLSVNGGTTLSSTLSVTGAATLSSSLDITGITTAHNTLRVPENNTRIECREVNSSNLVYAANVFATGGSGHIEIGSGNSTIGGSLSAGETTLSSLRINSDHVQFSNERRLYVTNASIGLSDKQAQIVTKA